MTNREWINQMSDEEFVKKIVGYMLCSLIHKSRRCSSLNCKECTEKWLKEEHKENEDEFT